MNRARTALAHQAQDLAKKANKLEQQAIEEERTTSLMPLAALFVLALGVVMCSTSFTVVDHWSAEQWEARDRTGEGLVRERSGESREPGSHALPATDP